jgi:hypothetical protein
VPGVTYEVFKVRVRNSDSGKGKSGGYRIIFQRLAADTIVLVTLYSKAEQEDIAAHEIRAIIDEYDQRVVDELAFQAGDNAGEARHED